MSSRFEKETSSDVDRDRAGLDLREVEDVADEVEKIGARRVNGAGELDLLAGQIVVRILGELLAEDQDAVERRAQLVRHVGQELGLVFGGERQLRRLFLQRAARLLDLLVLALDVDVALGELLRLLLQLLVGLLQLALLVLQLAGELLRLLEQPSVCIVASMVLSTMPMLSVSWSRKARWISLKR